PVIGNGQRCYAGETDCGDGGPALQARLMQPKSLAFSTDGTMYLTDGWTVRRVGRRGLIHTLIGGSASVQPAYCPQSEPISTTPKYMRHQTARQTRLGWPTLLAVSPLDNQLLLLDEQAVIYRLTP